MLGGATSDRTKQGSRRRGKPGGDAEMPCCTNENRDSVRTFKKLWRISSMATRPPVTGKNAATSAGAAKKSAKSAAQPAGKAPARATPQKKAAATITLKTVFEEMAERHDFPKKQANALLNAMVEAITKHLKNGDRIRMTGLGILEVKDRPARQARNPATGETIQVAASKKVAFRVSKELKGAV